jgi:hypothetical protein
MDDDVMNALKEFPDMKGAFLWDNPFLVKRGTLDRHQSITTSQHGQSRDMVARLATRHIGIILQRPRVQATQGSRALENSAF